jgi:group I intron endonuclease
MGKIYKIVNNVNNIMYIGSTTFEKLSLRMNLHRSRSRIPSRKSAIYTAMREIGASNFEIELIKDYPCETRRELLEEEYRIMNKMLKKGYSLYNTETKLGQASAEMRAKCRESGLKRGSLGYDPEKNRWVFQWRPETGVHKKRTWNVSKWGVDGAKAMALAFQNEIYPLAVEL